ncbi:unnamed protein product [Prorocentrum cordatum]|uniref:Uncharacterized protein n=1 Tax=Prorocentrum cordatum TaxID=2364126 RepID=A0ABN9PWD9_9DINO|nr:unnamed protein product [Polarella glacialis]
MAQQGAELARSPSAGSVASAAPEGAAAHGVGDEVEVDGVDSISQTRAYSAASRPAKAAEGPTVPPSRRYDPRHCEKLYGEHTKRIEKRDQLVAEKRRESEMRHRTLVKDFKLDQALSKEAFAFPSDPPSFRDLRPPFPALRHEAGGSPGDSS